jgi:hypothetical protein
LSAIRGLKKREEQAFGEHDSISTTVSHGRDNEPLRQGIQDGIETAKWSGTSGYIHEQLIEGRVRDASAARDKGFDGQRDSVPGNRDCGPAPQSGVNFLGRRRVIRDGMDEPLQQKVGRRSAGLCSDVHSRPPPNRFESFND